MVMEIINHIQTSAEIAMNNDPIIIRSLSFKRICESAIKTNEDLYKDYLKRTKKSQLTYYYKN